MAAAVCGSPRASSRALPAAEWRHVPFLTACFRTIFFCLDVVELDVLIYSRTPRSIIDISAHQL
jgi:hypothetical protein